MAGMVSRLLRRLWLRGRGLDLRLQRPLRVLPTPLALSWSEHEAPLEELETGTAKHLAFEQFQTRNMPLHWPSAPRQGEPRFDGVIIISEPFRTAL